MTTADLFRDPGAKRFVRGTHRVVAPEETLARVWPMAGRMGVTRLSVLTGLDAVGIPVAAAVRPNSRSVSVHQGKGATLAAAKASALMEAVEAFHAERPLLPLRLASFAEMAVSERAADPALLPHAAGRILAGERLLWVQGVDLFDARPLFVPFELVSADFAFPPPPGMGLFQATTNGLASGNHPLEAVTHALYEAIERDAVACWHASPEGAQDRRAVDLATVDDEASSWMLGRFAAAALVVKVWDVTSDIGIPVFLCASSSEARGDRVRIQFGAGCHGDRAVALQRALGESAQARLTVISGAREDIEAESYAAADQEGAGQRLHEWLLIPGRRRYGATPSLAGPDLRSDLDTILAGLRCGGLRHAAWVDLTRPEFSIPVARVIVPGLEGVWTPPSGEYVPGARAKRATSL